MGLKAKVEAIIYAAEEPITTEQIAALLKDMVLAEEAEERAKAEAAAQEETTASPEAEIGDEATAETSDATSEAAAGETVPTEAEVVETEVSEVEPQQPGAPNLEAAATEDSAAHEPAPEFTAVPADPKAPTGDEADAQASVSAPDATAPKKKKSKKELTEDGRIAARIRAIIEELIADYQNEDRGMEIRAVAGGFRMATKPEHHDVVRAFAKSLKPPVKLSLAALETLAVIAYKQPITVPEISEIRGVESGGVIGTLLDRKLITTAGRKQVVGRPILYKTSREFLMRFGLGGIADLPSMEEFEKLALGDTQAELFTAEASAQPQSEQASEGVPTHEAAEQPTEQSVDSPTVEEAPAETPESKSEQTPS